MDKLVPGSINCTLNNCFKNISFFQILVSPEAGIFFTLNCTKKKQSLCDIIPVYNIEKVTD
jgi:hypothetical protein